MTVLAFDCAVSGLGVAVVRDGVRLGGLSEGGRDQAARLLPAVESVSMVGIGTILGGGSATVGLPGWSDRQQVTVQYNEIGPAYFATLRTPLLRGREFDDRDTVQSPAVAIVNDTLATRFWPPGQAVGSMILVGGTARQVVGVVADVSMTSRSWSIKSSLAGEPCNLSDFAGSEAMAAH